MVQITVTVDTASASDIEAVAQELRGKGMKVDQVLDSIGMITGSIQSAAPAASQALQAVDGVVSVDAAQGVQLPPPDSDIQ